MALISPLGLSMATIAAFAAGPRKIRRRKNGAVRADFDGGVLFVRAQHEAGDEAALFDGMAPVFVLVGVQLAEVVAQDVGKIAAPAVAPVVAVQAVAYGLVRGTLHGDVERGVDA